MPLKWKAYSVVFLYMCLTLFTFIYGTEQILFRHDPWEIVKQLEKSNPNMNENSPMESRQSASSTDSNAAFRATLEQWMQSKKPYLNPDFRLLDLGQVLPLNRTYLSHFIHSEYDCTFYQFVNRYRIEEAKRMKMENPEMKIWEVSAYCGFSSPTVFSRTFTNITGMTPSEWARNNHTE